MHEDTIVSFSHPDAISISDPLTAVLRAGARRLLAVAVDAEVEDFVAAHTTGIAEAEKRIGDGKRTAHCVVFGVEAILQVHKIEPVFALCKTNRHGCRFVSRYR